MKINDFRRDFALGFHYVFRGVSKFYATPGLFPYALIPLLLVGSLYSGAFYVSFVQFLPRVSERIDRAFAGGYFAFVGAIIRFLLYFGAGLGLAILMAALASSLFECIGAVFMSRMVRKFEIYELRRPDPKIPLWQDCVNAVSCVIYSSITFFLYLFLFVLGFFIPVAPQVIAVFLLGRRYAISYCSESAFNRRWGLSRLAAAFALRPGLRSGFGAGCFLLLLIPVVSILFIPGFMVGGAMLSDSEF